MSQERECKHLRAESEGGSDHTEFVMSADAGRLLNCLERPEEFVHQLAR